MENSSLEILEVSQEANAQKDYDRMWASVICRGRAYLRIDALRKEMFGHLCHLSDSHVSSALRSDHETVLAWSLTVTEWPALTLTCETVSNGTLVPTHAVIQALSLLSMSHTLPVTAELLLNASIS